MEDIEQLIDSLRNGDFAAAGPIFSDIMSSKVREALNAEEIKVASEIFGGPLDDDEEPEDYEDDEEDDNDEDDDYEEEDE